MSRQKVLVVNWANLSDNDLVTGVDALQTQVSDDFAPVWSVDALLVPISRSASGDGWTWRELAQSSGGRRRAARRHGDYSDYWGLILIDEELDTPTEHPARVYGDRTRSGLPLTKVFVNRVPRPQDWCHAASRALLDMLADPCCSATAYHHPYGSARTFYAQTICDPVAAYDEGYTCGGRWVSNFTHPAYWRPGSNGQASGVKFDERGNVAKAFEIPRGGGLGYYDLATSTWRMRAGKGVVPAPPEVESRLEQRNRQPRNTPTVEMPDLDQHPTGALYPP